MFCPLSVTTADWIDASANTVSRNCQRAAISTASPVPEISAQVHDSLPRVDRYATDRYTAGPHIARIVEHGLQSTLDICRRIGGARDIRQSWRQDQRVRHNDDTPSREGIACQGRKIIVDEGHLFAWYRAGRDCGRAVTITCEIAGDRQDQKSREQQ